MKTKISIAALAVAIITSFSFISIDKTQAESENIHSPQTEKPMSGIALQDDYQF